MNRRDFVQLSAFLAAGGWKARAMTSSTAIPEPQFPSRLHLFVWRNWELANVDRMAQVVRATPEQILKMGASLGLPRKPVLTEDQLRRIYITVIRQNWHVLPDRQIIELLGWTSEHFAFTLKEDDFLDIKLGKVKPKCDELVYHTPSASEQKQEQWIRNVLRKNFGETLYRTGEGPAAFVSELSTFHYAPNRDDKAIPAANEIDLTSGWSIAGHDDILEAAAERFSRYMKSAMSADVAVRPSGSHRIELVRDAAAADGFHLEADSSHIRIRAQNDAGILQGIYHLENVFERREAPFLPAGESSSRFLWNPRYLYSYFALYGDPLMEPAADPFPDAYLERLARTGINGVWMQAVLNTLAPSKIFPEFGAGSETRLKNLNALVERAAKFGVKVYLYLNEPRAMPPSFFANHAEMKGSSHGGLNAICTSVPAVREWIAASLAHVFERVPDLGGIFCITMSENLTNCFSQGGAWGTGAPNAGDCPRCSKRKSWDAIGELIRTFHDGIRQSSKAAEVIAWDWGWGDELTRNLMPLLPKDARFMSMSEWDQPVHRGGVSTKVGEYSISVVGPGPRARRNWQIARNNGLRPMAKVQFNNTWEISAVPYIPVVQLILEHCENLRREQITGAQESWTCGGYASPNLAAVSAYYPDKAPSRTEAALSAATQRFGKPAGAQMVEAWQHFSTAFLEFPYGVAIYTVPTQHGPANPLRLKPTGYTAGMMLFPYDDYKHWSGAYPPAIAQKQFAKLADLWNAGLDVMQRNMHHVSSRKRAAAEQDLAIALTCHHHFKSVANQFEFYLLRDQAGLQSGPALLKTRARMREIAAEEIQLARKQYELARRHSVIGYEASNHYYYRPLDLAEKVLNCQYILDQLDNQSQV